MSETYSNSALNARNYSLTGQTLPKPVQIGDSYNITLGGVLPFFKAERIAAINWGFVDGKSQTKFPWDSSSKAYPDEPEPWFHDVLRRDGSPYKAEEVKLIRELTGVGK